jgi:AcrR family transcriptional regulator
VAGLRERKKRDTEARIAAVAADLFAARGFEAVAVVDVARIADVSEQTVYNHFPTKEDLVFDRAAEIEDALFAAIVDAAGGVAHDLVEHTSAIPLERSRGGMPRLRASSPTLSRAALERTRRQADRLAAVLVDRGEPEGDAAILAWALAGVLQLLIEELGAAQQAGEDPASTALRLHDVVAGRLARLRRLWD